MLRQTGSEATVKKQICGEKPQIYFFSEEGRVKREEVWSRIYAVLSGRFRPQSRLGCVGKLADFKRRSVGRLRGSFFRRRDALPNQSPRDFDSSPAAKRSALQTGGALRCSLPQGAAEQSKNTADRTCFVPVGGSFRYFTSPLIRSRYSGKPGFLCPSA